MLAITIRKVITAGLVVGEVPGDEVALEVAPLQFLIAPPRTVETPDEEDFIEQNCLRGLMMVGWSLKSI